MSSETVYLYPRSHKLVEQREIKYSICPSFDVQNRNLQFEEKYFESGEFFTLACVNDTFYKTQEKEGIHVFLKKFKYIT